MWLINTHTAELKFFPTPDDVPGGYAILSHVWNAAEEEDSYQKVRAAHEPPKQSDFEAPANPGSQSPFVPLTIGIDRQGRSDICEAFMQLRIPSENTELGVDLSSSTTCSSSSSAQCNISDHGAKLSPSAVLAHADARQYLCPKLRAFLRVAEKYSLDWAWADTCCIDRTNSAELAEAINSMFLYYSRAQVCIAYLKDVPCGENWKSSFIQSRWHERGWTLQELIAPYKLVFMAQDWTPLGTKFELAGFMEANIDGSPPADVLTGKTRITDMSFATRMSWAARRKTTREEDKSYCLFGIFGVNMPPVYGEGENAFYRLQEELIRRSPDTSLFAWMPVKEVEARRDAQTAIPTTDDWEKLAVSLSEMRYSCPPSYDPFRHLFAPSPWYFRQAITSDIIRGNGEHHDRTVSHLFLLFSPLVGAFEN